MTRLIELPKYYWKGDNLTDAEIASMDKFLRTTTPRLPEEIPKSKKRMYNSVISSHFCSI